MYLAEILFLAIVVYLAYRFVFNFLLPIVRTTHQVRERFREMRQEGSGQGFDGGAAAGRAADRGAAANSGADSEKRTYKPPAEDYIDFEEVK